MTLPLTIRAGTAPDLPAIRGIHLANWRAGHRGIMTDAFLSEPVAEEMRGKWAALPPKGDLLLVAESSGAVAGFALVRAGHPDGPLLESLHVADGTRGSGCGERLMRAVARELVARGHDRLWLEVLRDNAGARRFYARMGGTEGPVFSDILAGQTVPALKVVWPTLHRLLDGAEKMPAGGEENLPTPLDGAGAAP